jgi:hypothetical protein
LNCRFQADADLNFEIVLGVLRRNPEIDFQSAQEALIESLPDEDVLRLSAAQGRILVSHDVNTMPSAFRAMLAGNIETPGLILVPQWLSIGEAISQLVLLAQSSDASEWKGQEVWLPLRP